MPVTLDGLGARRPGGSLQTGESETDGLQVLPSPRPTPPPAPLLTVAACWEQRVLQELLAPTADQGKTAVAFEVLSLLSTWWRPDFDDRLYPYLPVHVSFPKESTKVYFVTMGVRAHNHPI